MTTTRVTLTVDVVDHGVDFTAGMIVGLLRGAGITVAGYVVDDEDDMTMSPAATEAAPAPPEKPAGPGSQNGRLGRPPVYSDEDKARALAVHQEDGLAAAVQAGPWSRATVLRWVKEASSTPPRPATTPPLPASATTPPCKATPPARRNFGRVPKPEGPRPAFPEPVPFERRPFDPDAVRYATADNVYPDGNVG